VRGRINGLEKRVFKTKFLWKGRIAMKSKFLCLAVCLILIIVSLAGCSNTARPVAVDPVIPGRGERG
jgi:predicted small secreted protein